MPHLLVIEDNPEMSALLHEYFGALGYGVTAVREGYAGLHAALCTTWTRPAVRPAADWA